MKHIMILMVLAALPLSGCNQQAEQQELRPSGTLEEDGRRTVEVLARQFEFEPDQIVVNQGETVVLEVTSEDVAHGLSIEAYEVDKEVSPEQTETITFTADRAGRFRFECSVYCGAGHNDMAGELVVLE